MWGDTMSFELGTQVQLKSGGPAMTVISVCTRPDGPVTCVWFDDRNKSNRVEFPAKSLKVYEPPST